METRKCSKCGERKPINKFYKKGFNKQGIKQYAGTCRLCQAEYHAKYYAAKKAKLPGIRRQPKEFTDADEERLFSAKRGAVSMRISAELANEACPQLDPKNWPIGVAETFTKNSV